MEFFLAFDGSSLVSYESGYLLDSPCVNNIPSGDPLWSISLEEIDRAAHVGQVNRAYLGDIDDDAPVGAHRQRSPATINARVPTSARG